MSEEIKDQDHLEREPITIPECLKRRVLVTFKDYFYGPEGQQYRAAIGPMTIVKAESEKAEDLVLVGHGCCQVCLPMSQFQAAVPCPDIPPAAQYLYIAFDRDEDEGWMTEVAKATEG